jgi:signal recognition particle subunit SRP68
MDVQMLDKSNQVKLDILISTSAMQNQNGIKQNDYYRYSNFCSNKINKLRKLYKITQGKRKFNKIEIDAERCVDSKILLIPILESERKWAKGMLMKTHMTNVGQDIKKLRYNISKKFRKSAQTAKKVFEICQEVSDTQTILEAEAYYSLLEANHLIFKRRFDESLSLLKRAASIYEKISGIKDTIESITYKEKINLIKTSIRLCVYNLSVNFFLYIFRTQLKLFLTKKNSRPVLTLMRQIYKKKSKK